MPSLNNIRDLVNEQIARIHDKRLVARIREVLVEPYAVVRNWDYGDLVEGYECWMVLEHRESNTGIAFCNRGFGPLDPWGLIFLSGPQLSIGMDCCWFRTLEDAVRESFVWKGANQEPNMTGADRIWNRAAAGGGDSPRPGDRALASLLLVHGYVMNGGVHHAIECVEPAKLVTAADGYAYFGIDDVAVFFWGATDNPILSNWTEDTEVAANQRYHEMIPDDAYLYRSIPRGAA